MNTFLKYFFVVINLVLVIFGTLCIAFVLWIEGVPVVNEVVNAVGIEPVLFYGGIILGSLLVFIGLCGALGACYEKRWILGIYLGIIAIIICLEIAALAFVAAQGRNDFIQQLETVWVTLTNDSKFLIQNTFNCCGYLNASEWNGNYHESCLNTTVLNETIPWSDTCSESVLNWFNNNIFVIGGAFVATILFQILQAVVTGLLIRAVNSSNQVEDDTSLGSGGGARNWSGTGSSHYNRGYDSDSFYGDASPKKNTGNKSTEEGRPTL